MKILLLLISITVTTICNAQITPYQSSPNINWQKFDTDNFEIIFPDFLESKARKTLQLLEHYRIPVTGPYKILPKKLKLVIRPDMNLPNGFVTLAPRRTEWFNYSSITPIVGSLEWMQSLAIHEYRHVVQYEYLNQGYINWGYKLFGESILGLIINYVMPTWYFEGDAVYAETTLSDAGRGRSPRFSQRLRAILTQQEIPTYDQLLAGDYQKDLPNFYVYGYFLITAGYKKYGKDFWSRVAKYATEHPWNIYALYNGFYANTGMSFEDFFNETFKGLSKEWKVSSLSDQKKNYEIETSPFKTEEGLYYLKKGLNTHWSLYKNDEHQNYFNIIPKISQIDINSESLVYTQQLPHKRYLYKGSSDIFLYNLKNKTHKRITENQRFYHPKFSKIKNQISAIRFEDKSGFQLVSLDANNGSVIKVFPKEKFENIAEAIWIDQDIMGQIVLNRYGKKVLEKLDTKTNQRKELLPPTRNNIYNLSSYQNFLYFEADYQGKVSIFEYDLKMNKLSLCIEPLVGSHSPFRFQDKLYYSDINSYGQKIKSTSNPCNEVPINLLASEDEYSSKESSDFYHKTKPIYLKDTDLAKVSAKVQDYSEGTELLKPHSWQFFSDRGFELNGSSSNTLGTKSLNLYLGNSYETSSNYLGGSFSYAKFYPILSISLDRSEREEELTNKKVTNWKEYTAQSIITLPYFHQMNLFSGQHLMSFSKGLIMATNNDYTSKTKINNEHMQIEGVTIQSSIVKASNKQNPTPQLGYNLTSSYYNLSIDERDSDNYLWQLSLDTFIPSFFENHSFGVNFKTEHRSKDETSYQLQNNYISFLEYRFSRGHEYEFTPVYSKYEFEYTLPISYPNIGFGKWIYINRIYSTIFTDITELNEQVNKKTLSSYGIEIYLNTNTFRKFPLNYGLRVVNKHGEDSTNLEFFLATTL